MPDLSTAHQLHLTCPAELRRLPALLALADEACAAAGADARVTYAVRLAVEEVVANIITHGYGPLRVGLVSLTLSWDATRLRIVIQDHAPPFDPARIPPPDLEAPVETRNAGGIGWALVQQLMTTVEHSYVPEMGNRLVLTRNLAHHA